MKNIARRQIQHKRNSLQDHGNPMGWLRDTDSPAARHFKAAFWSERGPSPALMAWLEAHPIDGSGWQAVILGCGMGEDAEALSAHGYQVTAFDTDPGAIQLCRQRYPHSHVQYQVANLLQAAPALHHCFDLVLECGILEEFSEESRLRAYQAIADMAAPFGVVLALVRADKGAPAGKSRPNLDLSELEGYMHAGLRCEGLMTYADAETPGTTCIFASYRRPAHVN